MTSRPSLRSPSGLLLIALLAPAPSGAQIVTDRPDFVESSATVGAGAFQLETSVSYGRAGSGSGLAASWTTPSLLRYGVLADLELRLESDGWTGDASGSAFDGTSGVADVALGLKWHTSDPSGARPSTALLLHADLPTGAERIRGDGVRPSLRLVAEWELPGGFALGAMPGVAVDRDAGDSYAIGIFGLVLGKALSETLRTYGELSLDRVAADDRGGSQGTVNAGLALLLGATTQLDVGVSWGAVGDAEDVRAGIGFSVLVPGR